MSLQEVMINPTTKVLAEEEMIVLAVVMGDGINSKQFAKGGYCTDSSFYLTSRSFDTSVSCEFVYESE